MKVTIRTVRGDPFEVEVEASDTVASVKEKIEVAKSEENYAKASQVLVFKGQILKDESTLGALDIKEKDFLVVTMMKKAAPKPSVQDVKPPEPVAVEQKAPEQQQAAATTATLGDQAGASTSDPQSYSSAASALARGAELEAAINQICEMGFEVEQVKKAMRAAFNNPERAVEYLTGGIPEGLEQQMQQQAAAAAAGTPVQGTPVLPQDPQQPQQQQQQLAQQQPTQQQQPTTGPNAQPLDLFAQGGGESGNVGGTGVAGNAGNLGFLRSNPQFQMIRTMVRSNPAVLEQVLAELGKHNPQLLQTINAHQDEFLQLINEQPTQDEQAFVQQMEQDIQQIQEAVQGQLSPEDEAAVGRLQQLGFERAQCVEAYLACDKNEELAANYLLENAMED
eukprot:TRINITY_DN582_c0_g2_i22.p1 TRINITY_DN582_c0_g2~~TRINITY_DN582_c0_g2_i22.p1  ORF type:complete len:393 (+),score=106.75 TRINITY_DN582_c0_g2_i22:130-1308(+)